MVNIGIDLGTTYSCIAYINRGGNPEIQEIKGNKTTPSEVYYDCKDDRMNPIVGRAARNRYLTNPENFITEIKRKMGENHSIKLTNGTVIKPPEVSAAILKELFEGYRKENPEQHIDQIVITVPASFGDEGRNATLEAATIAKLDNVSIINEPTAAAISYGYNLDGGIDKNILVYDLGGGTFDITLMRLRRSKESNEFIVLSTGGDSHLGGKDWDRKLKEYIIKKINEKNDTNFDINNSDYGLMQKAEDIKKRLTDEDEVEESFSFEGRTYTICITRDEFEQITHSLLLRTFDYVEGVINSAKNNEKISDESEISSIILVGGSSRMPQIYDGISDKFNKQGYNIEIKLNDPDGAIARGAALYANRNISGIDVRSVLSKTYGVESICTSEDGDESKDKSMISNILYKNNEIPNEYSKAYRPYKEGQDAVHFNIFEDDYEEGCEPLCNGKEGFCELEEGTKIGEVDLLFPEGISEAEKSIVVTFRVDEEGILHAIATCKDVVSKEDIRLHNSMSSKEINDAQKRISKQI